MGPDPTKSVRFVLAAISLGKRIVNSVEDNPVTLSGWLKNTAIVPGAYVKKACARRAVVSVMENISVKWQRNSDRRIAQALVLTMVDQLTLSYVTVYRSK